MSYTLGGIGRRGAGGSRLARRPRALMIAAATLCSLAASQPALAGFTAKDAQVMGRVLGFMDSPPPAQVTLALVYDPAVASSKAEAEALKGQLGGSFKAGNFTLAPKLVAIGDVAGAGANAILLMDGVSGSAVASVTKSKKIPCFTGDDAAVKSGACLIGIKTDPKVQILLNGGLAKASGITFNAAFRMMITEV